MQQANSAGKMVAGTRQTLRLIAAGRAERVLIARDADARIQQTVRVAAEAAGVSVEECPSMEALRGICRIAVPCATAAEERKS